MDAKSVDTRPLLTRCREEHPIYGDDRTRPHRTTFTHMSGRTCEWDRYIAEWLFEECP